MKVKHLIQKLTALPDTASDSEVEIDIRDGVAGIKVFRGQTKIDSVGYDDDHDKVTLNISEA